MDTLNPKIAVKNSDEYLGIPYPPSKRNDGENYGYISLVDHPEAIREIKELDGENNLKELIRRINLPGNIFETVRVLHWINEQQGEFRKIASFGFVFRDRQLFKENTYCREVCESLTRELESGRVISERPWMFEIGKAKFLAESHEGWIMDLYVPGYGKTQEKARGELDNILRSLIPFFESGGYSPRQNAIHPPTV